MMCEVEVFVIPKGQPTHPPGPPLKREVVARTRDGLREVLRAELEAEGYRVRAISIGPAGLVAYAEGHA